MSLKFFFSFKSSHLKSQEKFYFDRHFCHLVKMSLTTMSSLFLLHETLHRKQISHHIHHSFTIRLSGSLLMWIVIFLFNHKSEIVLHSLLTAYIRKEFVSLQPDLNLHFWEPAWYGCSLTNLATVTKQPGKVKSHPSVLHPFLSSFPSAVLFVYDLIITDIICLKVDWNIFTVNFLLFFSCFFSSQFSSHFIFDGH